VDDVLPFQRGLEGELKSPQTTPLVVFCELLTSSVYSMEEGGSVSQMTRTA
jgi:hypothetical protein